MCRLYLLLPPLLLLGACTPKCAPARTPNTATYTLAGRTFRVPAVAYVRHESPEGVESLDIQIGSRPIGPGEGLLLVSYYKAAGAPASAYKATLLTYTYNTYSVYYSVSYNDDLRCTLTKTRTGGYSGTFRGTYGGQGTATGQSSTITGCFTNVAVADPARP